MIFFSLLFATIFPAIFGYRIHHKITRFAKTLSSVDSDSFRFSTVEQIKATVPISSVASKLINKWTSVGPGKFVGLCPFHKDVNPSLHVTDNICMYHCFACGASGDIISLVQKLEHLSFLESLYRIQELIGCNNSYFAHRKIYNGTEDSYHHLLEHASQYFEYALWEADAGPTQQYLESRKISNVTARRYRLGLCRLSNPIYIPFGRQSKTSDASNVDFIHDQMQLPRIANESSETFSFSEYKQKSPSIDSSLISFLQGKGFTLDAMKATGLVTETMFNNSLSQKVPFSTFHRSASPVVRIAEKFRGRLIFPILDPQNRVVAFGGRAMKSPILPSKSLEQDLKPFSQVVLDTSIAVPKSSTERPPKYPKYFPKYLNSAESESFKKRELLYGLNLAKDSIAKDGYGIIVEGYFDVLSLSEIGYQNVVGCLGTAISINQLEMLAKCSKQRKVVLLMDNDAAGSIATMRVCERLISSQESVVNSIDLRIAQLPSHLVVNEMMTNADHGPTSKETIIVQDLAVNSIQTRTRMNIPIKDCSDLLVQGQNHSICRDIVKNAINKAIDWKIWLIERELTEYVEVLSHKSNLHVPHSYENNAATDSTTFSQQRQQQTGKNVDSIEEEQEEEDSKYERFKPYTDDSSSVVEECNVLFYSGDGYKYDLTTTDLLILGKNMVQLLRKFPIALDRTLLAGFVAQRLAGHREFIRKRLEFDILTSLN